MIFVPKDPEEPPETILQLVAWMEKTCNNFRSYALSDELIDEGYGIERQDHEFCWYYTERGIKHIIHQFNSELEVVQYAYQIIRRNIWSWSYMIAFVRAESTAREIELELRERGISFHSDNIPYGGPDDRMYRVFVFGCDVKRVSDLKVKE